MKNKLCGIYAIKNKINGKMYIGASSNIKSRWKVHRSFLKLKKHSTDILQESWEKYGGDNFEFKVIEECLAENLLEREAFYIKKLKAKAPYGFNRNDGGCGVPGKRNGMYGKTHTKEVKEAQSQRSLGNTYVRGTVKKHKRSSSSRYYGVSRHSHKLKNGGVSYYWRATLSWCGKRIYLGQFPTEIEAAKVFDIESWNKHKDLKKLNFSEDYICE